MAWSGSPAGAGGLRLRKAVGLNATEFCRIEELDAVAALAARIGSHPAALGVYLRDEPSAKQMPMLGRLAAELMKAMPAK